MIRKINMSWRKKLATVFILLPVKQCAPTYLVFSRFKRSFANNFCRTTTNSEITNVAVIESLLGDPSCSDREKTVQE